MKLTVRMLRIVPFACLAVLSLWVAGRSPLGRRPFQFDWTISGSEVARVVTKVPHLRATAVLFLLATLAVGSNRLLLAFGLTMIVGVGWELAETTVVGHHAQTNRPRPRSDWYSNRVSLCGIRSLVRATH